MSLNKCSKFGLHLVIPSSSTFTATKIALCRQLWIAAASILSARITKSLLPELIGAPPAFASEFLTAQHFRTTQISRTKERLIDLYLLRVDNAWKAREITAKS